MHTEFSNLKVIAHGFACNWKIAFSRDRRLKWSSEYGGLNCTRGGGLILGWGLCSEVQGTPHINELTVILLYIPVISLKFLKSEMTIPTRYVGIRTDFAKRVMLLLFDTFTVSKAFILDSAV